MCKKAVGHGLRRFVRLFPRVQAGEGGLQVFMALRLDGEMGKEGHTGFTAF